MFNEFEKFLFLMVQYTTIAYIGTWLFYIYVFKRVDSSAITLSSVMIFSLIMTVLTPYLYEFASVNKGVISKAVWHLTFVAFNLMAMSVIRGAHSLFKIHVSKITFTVIVLFAVQSGLQIIRLVEKALFETNVLSKLYTLGIASVNIMFVFLGAFCVISAFKERKTVTKDI